MTTRLSTEELIELGASLPTDSLTEWASGQLAATKGRESRLQSRGVATVHLTGMQDLLGLIGKRQEMPENSRQPSEAAAFARGIRDEALQYRREVMQIAQVEFGTAPDLIAKFRTGVRTGRLILPLKRELETLVGLLREHASQLGALGATEGFIARGDHLIGKLQEVKEGLDAASKALPPPAAQQCRDKGLLFDLIRNLVQVGRLEFAEDPEQAAAFRFIKVRWKGSPPASRKGKVADRKGT